MADRYPLWNMEFAHTEQPVDNRMATSVFVMGDGATHRHSRAPYQRAEPFGWTKTADDILKKRGVKKSSNTVH
jgi:hypothetical protein